MGYTHYWYRKEELSRSKFRLAIADIRKVEQHLNPEIQFEYDEDKPVVFNDKLIRFNGIGENGHETFYVERKHKTSFPQKDDAGRFFAFCKTNEKPYDEFVCCCLIILNHYFGEDFVVSSDGDLKEDWQVPIKICQEVLGYGTDFEFKAS